MSDLTNVLGGPWSPLPIAQPEPIEVQIKSAMEAAGFAPPKALSIDGRVHRFDTDAKGKKAGWYVFFGDGIPAGRFGCWKAGSDIPWRADVGRGLTDAEQMALARRTAEARRLRDEETKKRHETVADVVDTIWSGCVAADPEHPYLIKKQIGAHGARVTGDGRLVLPVYADGKLSTLQYIDHDGNKLFHGGGRAAEGFHIIGDDVGGSTIHVAEGFATAASIHEATGLPCAIAYSASNIPAVVAALAGRDVYVVADNDGQGTGEKYARQSGARYLVVEMGDANDYACAGHDLKALLYPPVTDWLVPADDFCTTPTPIKWLVKHWLQDEALIMVHGPSGHGKTFVVLDWCMHMAAGLDSWNGHNVKQGAVVYLAGEGHNGLRARIAAWKRHNSAPRLNMWLSKAGCDLNTKDGYNKVQDHIRALGEVPRLIVVDTLHRFLDGDENSAQDAKGMIDACGALMQEFGCSVLLVHHTGVSEESQHRARGSSAWKGALEIEISVVKAADTIRVVQKKIKDGEEAEPVHMCLQSVELPGWIDEDGEQVSSVVPVVTDAPVERKKESKLDGWKKVFESAWWASGAEQVGGSPYISRSSLVRHLVTGMGMSEAAAKKAVQPSELSRPIGGLLVGGIIAPKDHGWVVLEPVFASSLNLGRGQ